jgi:hypothetical protein
VEPPPFDEDAAKLAVTGFIDYFAGRAIKMDISGDYACPAVYDEYVGVPNAAAMVNLKLRGINVLQIDVPGEGTGWAEELVRAFKEPEKSP